MSTLFVIVLDHALKIAINIHEEETGLPITQRQSRQHSAVTQTDKNFADDTALISNAIREAKLLLQGVQE